MEKEKMQRKAAKVVFTIINLEEVTSENLKELMSDLRFLAKEKILVKDGTIDAVRIERYISVSEEENKVTYLVEDMARIDNHYEIIGEEIYSQGRVKGLRHKNRK